ncbi:hypothetical protein [Alienimonas californiensis]|uniref:Uncharacterized protein n=1 Tax=Alienimonas californiensis TaxID=2527989 RepID=A0A517PA95_9PLAN|nr:hypothetical protein [Alienimonas californiensis]QDT16282.1 hypothetical protein CA12_23830 [Alienimonas californiensis]
MSDSADPPGPPSFHLDGRLYVREMQNWKAVVKQDFAKLYCHAKMPGEDYYHLLTGGEIYLDDGESQLCLNCAVRTGVLTTDRQHWQREAKPTEIRVVPDRDVGLE